MELNFTTKKVIEGRVIGVRPLLFRTEKNFRPAPQAVLLPVLPRI